MNMYTYVHICIHSLTHRALICIHDVHVCIYIHTHTGHYGGLGLALSYSRGQKMSAVHWGEGGGGEERRGERFYLDRGGGAGEQNVCAIRMPLMCSGTSPPPRFHCVCSTLMPLMCRGRGGSTLMLLMRRGREGSDLGRLGEEPSSPLSLPLLPHP
jgi:hypothetical protein